MPSRLLRFLVLPFLATLTAGTACSAPCEDTLTCDIGDDDGAGGGGGVPQVAGIGTVCQSAEDCDEGSCIDGFCCASATCDGVCVSCGIEGSEGQCVPVLAGAHDDTCVDGLCDGSGTCSTGKVLSTEVVGASGSQFGVGIHVAPDGTILTGVAYDSSFNWGDEHTAPSSGTSTVVCRLDQDLAPAWTRTVTDPNTGAALTAFAANSNGESRATGIYVGTISILGQTVTAPTGGTGFVVGFNTAGSPSWLRNLTTAGTALVYDVAVGEDGSTYLGGGQLTAVDFGDGPNPEVGDGDGFLIKYDANGNLAWKKLTAGAGSETVLSVVTTPQSEVVAVGTFTSELDFGGGPLSPQGDQDVFLVKYDAAGNHLWSRSVGQSASVRINDLQVDSDGNIAAVGYFNGTISLDGVDLESSGGDDVVVLSFDSLGSLRWARNFGNFNDQVGRKAAVDASGNIYFTGYYTGSIDFGLGPLQTAGGEDGFITKLAPDGTALWSRALAGPSNDHRVEDVSIAPDGSAVVTGWTSGEATFGGEAIDTAEGLDIFMARLAP